MLGTCFATPSSSRKVVRRLMLRSEAVKMVLLKLTCMKGERSGFHMLRAEGTTRLFVLFYANLKNCLHGVNFYPYDIVTHPKATMIALGFGCCKSSAPLKQCYYGHMR